MTKTKNIAVLLTCHNRKAKTLACLEALYKCEVPEGIAFDVFLTDDGSTDGTGDAIRSSYPKVNVIQGDGNLYWNRGMHKAWVVASETKEYDFYLWLNDDTLLFKHSLTVLIFTSQEMKHQSIIVGTTCMENMSNILTYGGRNSKCQLIIPTDKPRNCDYFNGNIVLIPNFAYNKIGMNDSIFHHALGDFDYGKRAVKKGIKLFVAPTLLGACNEHEHLPTWCNPSKSLAVRLRAFRTPLGHNPEEYFVYEHRHNGLLLAIWHYITNNIRVFFPKLWIKI